MTPEFDIVDSYYGWGDPGTKGPGIWFIGIEEADEFSEDLEETKKEINRLSVYKDVHYSCVSDFAKENTGRRTIPNIESRIVSGLTGTNWEQYQDQKLWHEGSGVFHANLFPLGKASLAKSHSAALLEFFGFATFQEYENDVRNRRFKDMFQFWMRHRPQATVCFGSTAKDDFEQLFSQLDSHLRETSPFFTDTRNKIVLTPHFSRGFSSESEGQLVKILKDWKVTLTA